MAVVLLPILWFVSEFQDKRWPRILLGIGAIGMSYLVASAVGGVQSLGDNAYFGNASQQLVDTTVTQLEADNAEQVLKELKTLQDKYHPTYENRADYEELVEEYSQSFAEDSPAETTDGEPAEE
ncbi:hypothetical protein [Aeoliella mucimassa]|uniref:hypothetical protein n=1 Tax=Aeoliella mucimassa TaxID=2527972 RepID=UPI001E4B4375|nr:hypothetical protein [Aeoliella mucimassa]